MYMVNWFSVKVPKYFKGKRKIFKTNIGGRTGYSTGREKNKKPSHHTQKLPWKYTVGISIKTKTIKLL